MSPAEPVRRVLCGLLALATLLLPRGTFAQTAATEHAAEHLHGDPRAYMAALDDPKRDAWQKPHEVVSALGLREGDTVADIGAGSGYFTLRFARHVGRSGKVFAVDLSSDMVGELKKRAAAAGLENIVPVQAAADDPRLPAGSAGVVFFCNVWHHIESRGEYLATLKPALAPGGRLVILDFHKNAPVGPPASMKLTREEVLRELEATGFTLQQEHTFLPHQYFLVFSAR
jgi:arsenite methyltransferase